MKNRPEGGWPRSRDLLFEFWDPQISLEQLKIQTSNFTSRLKVMDSKPKNEKLVKRGRGLGHVTYFPNFGSPLSGTAEDANLKFCRRIDRKAY